MCLDSTSRNIENSKLILSDVIKNNSIFDKTSFTFILRYTVYRNDKRTVSINATYVFSPVWLVLKKRGTIYPRLPRGLR